MRILKYRIRRDVLIDRALTLTTPGVGDADVIVSLTSYGRRILEVGPVIESIFEGSVRPAKVILWLGDSLKNKPLPIILQRQMKRGLEVKFVPDIRSYTKIIPALKHYPDSTIITIDDDALYPYDLVERLVNAHSEYPDDIIAARVKRIKLGKNGRPERYRRWTMITEPECSDASPLNFLTGVGGVLYPPHCLDDEVFNKDVFLDICKYADDVWLYAMALKAGTITRKCPTHTEKGNDFIGDDIDNAPGLRLLNMKKGKEMNDVQFAAVMDYYNLWDKLR